MTVMCGMESHGVGGNRKGVTIEPRGQPGHHPNMTLLIFQCSYAFQKTEAKVQEICLFVCFLNIIFVDLRERDRKEKGEGEGETLM